VIENYLSTSILPRYVNFLDYLEDVLDFIIETDLIWQ